MTDTLAEILRDMVRAIVREELRATADPGSPAQLLSVEEAAGLAGVGRSWMYEAIARGQCRSVKLGRRRLVPSDAIAEMVEQSKTT